MSDGRQDVRVVVPACPPALNPEAARTLLLMIRAEQTRRDSVSPGTGEETGIMDEAPDEGLLQPRAWKPTDSGNA